MYVERIASWFQVFDYISWLPEPLTFTPFFLQDLDWHLCLEFA